jgi:hypothetical protein
MAVVGSGTSNVTAAVSSLPTCFSWCHSGSRPTGARVLSVLGSTDSAQAGGLAAVFDR